MSGLKRELFAESTGQCTHICMYVCMFNPGCNCMQHIISIHWEVCCEEQAIVHYSGSFKLSVSDFVSNPGTKILFFMATPFKVRRRNVAQISPVVTYEF